MTTRDARPSRSGRIAGKGKERWRKTHSDGRHAVPDLVDALESGSRQHLGLCRLRARRIVVQKDLTPGILLRLTACRREYWREHLEHCSAEPRISQRGEPEIF